MINLSEYYLKSPRASLVNKVKTYFEPDYYIAESITDFKEQRESITIPFYKKMMFSQLYNGPSYYVLMHNLKIEMHSEDNHYFILHDHTNHLIALWHNDPNYLLRSEYSFEHAQQEQNLQARDIVSQVCINYLQKIDLPIIVHIKKNYSPTTKILIPKKNKPEACSPWSTLGWKPAFL